MTSNARNTKSRIFAMPAAKPARPKKPGKPAISARTKNMRAHYSMARFFHKMLE